MSKKPSNDQAADDWAGLAQNLFGINLGKGGDEDLLDDDMFKVDIPKPPEPPPVVLQSEVEFAPEAPVPPVAATAAPVQPVAKLPAKPPAPRVAKPKPVVADSFGAGILEDEAPSEEVGVTFEEATAESCDDDGLTLPDDYDAEGLTLPADYDDGLTLAPEAAAVSQTSEDFDDEGDEEEDEDASDTEVLPAPRGEKEGEGSSDTRRRRQPRRTREDAYWDMLENWEWEEIPDHDSPRSDADRPRSSSRGDRGDRRGGGGRSRRGGSSRDERPRSDDRPPAGDRPARTERPAAETAGAAPGGADDRPQRPRRDDRPRDDRGRRDDRPRGERRPERDDRRRDEPRASAPTQPTVAASNSSDDFGSGIFEAPVASAPAQTRQEPQKPRRSSEDAVAQSSRAADAVVRSDRGASNRPIEDDLVWPDDDSDVRSAPANSVVETSGLPSAETAGESDETVSESDVRPLDEDDEALRPRRRRRRRRGPRSESSESSSAPPDGNEGTTFDLSDALDTDSETPDFIPSASAEDSASSDEFGAGVAASDSRESTGDEQSSEQRGRRRRRRRRRPSDGSAPESAEREDREPSDSDDADEVSESRNEEREEREERTVIKPITYSNIPSWEEAIKYLLQPNLVGRNLGPDDADDSLENDPRGSGGAEPTPPPPQRRRSSGGGGRGRRR